MSEAYLSLGSNMGDRIDNLSRAVALLDRPSEGVKVEQVSPVFETAPVGYKDQDDFLNICVKVKTDLEPLALLSLCQKIEETLHRVRTIRWGPRTIDVDMICRSLRRDLLSHIPGCMREDLSRCRCSLCTGTRRSLKNGRKTSVITGFSRT